MMADEIDRAQGLEELHRQSALERALEAARAPAATNSACADCGEAIDPARRKAAPESRLCVPCAREAELRVRVHRQM